MYELAGYNYLIFYISQLIKNQDDERGVYFNFHRPSQIKYKRLPVRFVKISVNLFPYFACMGV